MGMIYKITYTGTMFVEADTEEDAAEAYWDDAFLVSGTGEPEVSESSRAEMNRYLWGEAEESKK